MTIAELKEWLVEEKIPDTVELVIASDPEGNNFFTLDGMGAAFVTGQGHNTEVEFEEDVSKNEAYKPCVVLWP